MPQETNLNRTPYFDDFDAKKDFHKVLFKPGYSIQARELTTLQSILQNQIEKFGRHFFKEGSRVIPGAITHTLNYRSVQVEPEFSGLPLNLYQTRLVGKEIKGSVSGVTAKIKDVATNTDTGNVILFIDYKESGTNFQENIFRDNENLTTLSDISFGISNIIPAGEDFAKAINSNSTNIGSAAFISEGIYFIRGYFVRVSSETLVLDNFGTKPSYRVGLYITEEIVNADVDESLYDNANGFSNYAAPGADRLKISTSLIKKSLDNYDDANFIEVLRINNGVVEKVVDKTEYSIIADELARRTYDESGDYYITPFDVYPRNSLNDRIGNNGLFVESQLTPSGNTPSDNLLTYKISPGKAYIRGFEVTKDSQTFIDIDKPRSTNNVELEGVSFNCGPSLFVNNAYGQPDVGIAITNYISLRDSRMSADKTIPAGNEIGIAKAYDYSIVSSTGITTTYELRVFDIQTFTSVGLSTNITLPISALIEGKTSGAKGFLRSSVSNSTSLILQDVSGRFVKDEGIVVSGISTYGQVVKSIRDYKLSDVYSVYSYRSTATNTAGFNADLDLSGQIQPTLNIPNESLTLTVPSFTISAKDPDSGICTVTSTTTNFIGIATIGNIISYTRAGFSTITYNKITSVSTDGKSVGLSAITKVAGICEGDTTSSQINTSELSIRFSKITNTDDPSLTTPLSKSNVSTIDTENTDISLKRQYNIASFSANSIIAPTLETDYTYQPYANQRYILTYSNGFVETLTADKFIFTNGFKNLQIKNLSIASGSNATLIVSVKKDKVKEKIKKVNRINSILIDRSSKNSSGVGNTTLNDGLSYSPIYGTRIQDKEICLNDAEVTNVLAIFESSDANSPNIPTMNFVSASLTGPNKLATDVIVGESVIGSESNAVATVISKSTNSIEFVYRNESRFVSGEIVSFEESQINGTISTITIGDKNILSKYKLDCGYRSNYYDFSRLVKIDSNFNPTKKLKIIFENYYVESSDVGDVYTVDSYPTDQYSKLPYPNNGTKRRLSDIIDIRPRVSSYSNSSIYSPFDFRSRIFTGSGQASNYQISPNETFLVSFSYYLPRIDKLFLSKEGVFQLQRGIPVDSPSAPKNVDGLLEIATISLPAYLYNINDVSISYATHKRYRMEDISRLEVRIANLEYYTQLSLLEVSTESLSIKTNGVDRFKCGFFVDNFKSHAAHDVTNPLFKASIDKSKGYLRPPHYTTAIDLIGQSSVIGIGTTANAALDYNYDEIIIGQNIKRNKKIITLQYSNKKFVTNPFATRVENVTPFLVTSYTGIISLNPSSDTWVDTRKLAPNRVTIEGSYKSTIQQLDVNPQTGFSQIDWGAWQTDWIGVEVSSTLSSTSGAGPTTVSERELASSKQISSNFEDGRIRTVFNDTFATTSTSSNTISNTATTSVTSKLAQNREGIRWNVTEQIDSQMLGARIVNNEFIKFMRARNIEFISRKLKPYSQMYAFFDKVDVSRFCMPKLIEISMLEGTFIVGETITAIDSSNGSFTGLFRLSASNHKTGPYNSPIETYSINPYSTEKVTLQSNYTSSSTILNIDTASLQEAAIGNFHGRIVKTSILIGKTSGARAKVKDLRLVTDDTGTLIGSFFVPNTPTISFETGIKQFKLSNSSIETPIPGTTNSFAEKDFYAQGLLQTSQDTNLGIRNANVRKETFADERLLTASDQSVSQSSITVTNTSTSTFTENREVYSDPLAQTFIVGEPNGIFLTKVDLYFYSKPTTNLPVIIQIRPVTSGVPSTEVIPFSEVHLLPSNIITSSDATLATVVYFESPVFLENKKEYAIVILSDSTDYQVWISRMGEEDLTGMVPSVNNPIPEFSFRSMSGFDDTPGAPGWFGSYDYTEARREGFSDADIRFYLENEYKGQIGWEVQSLISGASFGRLSYFTSIPSIRSMVDFQIDPSEKQGVFLNITETGNAANQTDFFGGRSYVKALNEGFTDADIRYYLENVWKGALGGRIRNLLADSNWGRSGSSVSINNSKTSPQPTKKIVSKQPTLGSLFKSQNGSTWEPSGYEDLKFTLYKAEFITNPGSYSFYNPIEGGDYNTLAKLKPETVNARSNKLKIGLSTSVTYVGIVPGVSIGITNKSISGNLIGIAGSVSTINVSGFGLTSYSVGFGYTTYRYDNLQLTTITGEGSGLVVDAYFVDGKLDVAGAGIVTVREGGYGYRVGDIVGIPTTVSFGSGARLSVQSLGSFNTLLLDNVQGNYDNCIGNRVTYQPTSISGVSSYIGLATVSYIQQNNSFDGLHLMINNQNHGMYSTNNLIRINNMRSDLKPVKLSKNIDKGTADILLDSISIFSSFENVGVSTTNPGYVRIQNELVQYTGVSTSTSSLTGITRGIDASVLGTGLDITTSHDAGELVEKYEFNGVSLRRINRIHNLTSPLATVPNPIDIDDLYIKLDMSDTTFGVTRSNNNSGIPDLYFNETKSGSNFNYSEGDYITSSQNIVFSSITPNVNVFTPKGTGIGSRIRTVSATSVDGNESSFIDQGFESIQLNNINDLSSLRLIASKDNEDSKLTDLPGNKSFTLTMDLFTSDSNVSPVIDMERISMILTSNRINNPITVWPGDSELASFMRKSSGDPNCATYVSNKINLTNPSTSLKVLFGAYKPNGCDIRVMYKVYREDSDNTNLNFEFFPGYENIDGDGKVINAFGNTGNSDIQINPNIDNSFSDYEYSIDQLPPFNGFVIKIIMTGTDQSKSPLIKELRAISLA